MRIELRDNAGLWSGLLFIGTGAAAIVMAADFRLGSALRMGPGYFPAALGGILILLGIVVLAKGLKDPQPILGRWSLRALVLLPLSLVLFGVLMEYAGFVPASARPHRRLGSCWRRFQRRGSPVACRNPHRSVPSAFSSGRLGCRSRF